MFSSGSNTSETLECGFVEALPIAIVLLVRKARKSEASQQKDN
jgi:hypothetical protein